MKHPIKIAITGKIASGKSTVAEILKDLGFLVFESDKEVDKLFRDKRTINKIKALFLRKINNLIKKDGSINKVLLGDYVFLKKNELKNLEDLIHPLLKEEKEKFIDSNKKEKVLFLTSLYCSKKDFFPSTILLFTSILRKRFKRKEF